MSIIDTEVAVRVARTTDVNLGDTIWAPEDYDWLDVARVTAGNWETMFSRDDGSIAEFSNLGWVLVKVSA